MLLEEDDLNKVMDRILENQDFDQALVYEPEVESIEADAVVQLCTSESGIYKAYGLISPEYGTAGVLLEYMIDGEPNWNYLYEDWSYNRYLTPSLQEQERNVVTFIFSQGLHGRRELIFDTYETGTMSARD